MSDKKWIYASGQSHGKVEHQVREMVRKIVEFDIKNLTIEIQSKETYALREENARLRKALEFYAKGKNLTIDQQGRTVHWPDGTEQTKQWRIGPPYLVNAEMGQTARDALRKNGEG